jgi:hypothetical protein
VAVIAEPCAADSGFVQAFPLHHGAHRAVEDRDAAGEGLFELRA